jgi:hypothetical protein
MRLNIERQIQILQHTLGSHCIPKFHDLERAEFLYLGLENRYGYSSETMLWSGDQRDEDLRRTATRSGQKENCA